MNTVKVIAIVVLLIWLAPLTDELRFWDILGDNWNFWWGLISGWWHNWFGG